MAPVHYQPQNFPPDDRLDWAALVPLIGPASVAVARYDGLLEAVPNPDILVAPLGAREAVLSSRIEGTQATTRQVLEYQAGQEPPSAELRDDVVEVLNYRAAMREAQALLSDLPLCLKVIRAAHRVLLQGARGRGRAPGEFRRIPNWIGSPGCTIDQARFVPIEAGKLITGLGRWEKYLHEGSQDRLVQLAVLHAEFEALHPFLDGNGRLGRMLVPLYLWQKDIIHQPNFYISAFLEANRDIYYERLLAVSRDDDWTGWCRFFLEAVRAQAEDSTTRARGILDLYDRTKRRVASLTHARYALDALDFIFENPIFTSADFSAQRDVPAYAARRVLNIFRDDGILKLTRPASGRQSAIFEFTELLDIAESDIDP